MAKARKRGNSWRIEVREKGISQSGSFSTKARADAWAARVKTEIADGIAGNVPNKPFSALLERYRDFVSVHKAGERWERLRIGLYLRDHTELVDVNLRELNATHVAAWRDKRLAQVSPGSVLREWKLLSSACNVARREWHWLKVNPFSDVKRPKPPDARDVMFSDAQIERLTNALGTDASTATGRTCIAFLFALETAMRIGEICALTVDDIQGTVAKVRGIDRGAGKTRAARRDVPLSIEALRLLALLPAVDGNARIFRINTQQADALFRKGKARALVYERHFHDSRANALTRMAKKLDILALAKAVGHKDLRQLQVYYRESAADMAARLG